MRPCDEVICKNAHSCTIFVEFKIVQRILMSAQFLTMR